MFFPVAPVCLRLWFESLVLADQNHFAVLEDKGEFSVKSFRDRSLQKFNYIFHLCFTHPSLRFQICLPFRISVFPTDTTGRLDLGAVQASEDFLQAAIHVGHLCLRKEEDHLERTISPLLQSCRYIIETIDS